MSREAGKVVPVRPKKPYKGRSSIVSDILNLVPSGDDWFTLPPGRFTSKVKISVPIEQEARWAPEPVLTF
jgi:hypothetical protein